MARQAMDENRAKNPEVAAEIDARLIALRQRAEAEDAARAVRLGHNQPAPDKRPDGMSKREWKELRKLASKRQLKAGDVGPTEAQLASGLYEIRAVGIVKGQVTGRAYHRLPWFETLARKDRARAVKEKRPPAISIAALKAMHHYRDAHEAAAKSEIRCGLDVQEGGRGSRADAPVPVVWGSMEIGRIESALDGTLATMRAVVLHDRSFSDIAMERYGSRDREFIVDGQFINRPAPRSNTHVTAISQEFALGLVKLVEAVAQ